MDATVALKVTDCPGVEGFAEEVGVLVELPACTTTSTNAADTVAT
jgi:hypothetical protein